MPNGRLELQETQIREVLGTRVAITLPGKSFLFQECFGECQRIERAYSRFLEDSELTRLNNNLGKWQDASDEMLALLSQAEQLREETRGNFDVTIKAALDHHGYDKNYSFTPKNGLPPTGGPGGYEIDWPEGRVLLRREIDFGGLGKGYALDRMTFILEKHRVSNYLLNAGGDILSKRGGNGEPWTILLEHPDDSTRAIGKLELDGRALASSATNRRNWGAGRHHLINPRDGLPAAGVKASFAIADSGIAADAYAKACLVAGFAGGAALAQALSAEVMLISDGNKVFTTNGFPAELFT